jgi:uncharacterized membrane protein YkoI
MPRRGNSMKLNRLFSLVAIAVLGLGAVGAASYRAFAQSARDPVAQSQDCANQDDDTAQIESEDADSVELQCGDQNDTDTEEAVSAAETDDVEEQVGDQNTGGTGAEVGEAADGQETAPVGTPAITAEAARSAAETYLNAGTATQVELDDEDGTLIYSVEIGGADVKVDAMTGVVLSVETGQD